MPEKIKELLRKRGADLLILAIIILVAVIAFGLGRLSALFEGEREFRIEYPAAQAGAALFSAGGYYVASRGGSAYYFPWCGTALRIKPVNLVRFETREDAERAGYRAGNCSGL